MPGSAAGRGAGWRELERRAGVPPADLAEGRPGEQMSFADTQGSPAPSSPARPQTKRLRAPGAARLQT
jgi:nitrate reductase alpha subunit